MGNRWFGTGIVSFGDFDGQSLWSPRNLVAPCTYLHFLCVVAFDNAMSIRCSTLSLPHTKKKIILRKKNSHISKKNNLGVFVFVRLRFSGRWHCARVFVLDKQT
jgi:hypothetical protein